MAINPARFYFLPWKDKRRFVNEKLVGAVTHLGTGEVYGADSDLLLRKKFACLIAAFPFVIVGRSVYRLGHILIGTWAKEAHRDESLKWRKKRLVCVLNGQIDQAPGRARLVAAVFARSLFNLTRDLGKLVTLPIACVLVQLSGLYGLIRPLDGRAFLATVEHAWGLNLEGIRSRFEQELGNYLAPCLQPKSVARQRNFVAAFPDYNPGTMRSLLLSAEKEAKRYEEYLTGIDLTPLSKFRDLVGKRYHKDDEETDCRGQLLTAEELQASSGYPQPLALEVKQVQQTLAETIAGIQRLVNGKNAWVDCCIDQKPAEDASKETATYLQEVLNRLPSNPERAI